MSAYLQPLSIKFLFGICFKNASHPPISTDTKRKKMDKSCLLIEHTVSLSVQIYTENFPQSLNEYPNWWRLKTLKDIEIKSHISEREKSNFVIEQ